MDFKLSLIALLFICRSAFTQDAINIASSGQKPNVTVDKDRTIRIVYGKEKTLYYTESLDQGKKFSDPVKVCTFSNNVVLAMGRGPQIASANGNIVISCVADKGNVLSIHKDAGSKKWSEPVQVNDIPGKALEGFCSLVANDKEFYILWHDLRSGKNELYGSVSADGGKKWNTNTVIYSSSDTSKSICPCCKSSLTVDNKGKVYAMWRNLINGSRDLYFMPFDKSAEAQKLGTGTWLMNSCPMDGGSMASNSDGQITTIWRRTNSIYTCEQGKEEVQIGEGRNPVIASGSTGNFIAYQK
jgi:hypothetical protein